MSVWFGFYRLGEPLWLLKTELIWLFLIGLGWFYQFLWFYLHPFLINAALKY